MKTTFTKSDLKHAVSSGTDSHFFDRSSMKFFGDTMANYGLRVTTINEHIGAGFNQQKTVYELYRRKPVKHGLKDSAYFDMDTFKRVFIVN